MAAVKKITLSPSRDIPFDKLVLSQANVRRIKAGVSVEELAEDIARRGLLQGLSVRPVLDAAGAETGLFEIPAGGRRYRALELLVKQKRLAKTAPIPCVVRVGGIAEEDSLAENVQRAPLHPLDQFRAFLTLREKGQSEEEIAAAFFVSVNVVKQRLKLASVSPTLLDIYAEDGMTLDQLMAFTVSGDHERQEQVFDRLQHSHDRQPYVIRRMLTEGAVRASEKRAQFIGVEAYEATGGTILRDLFQGDDGGWLQDVALVDRMVAEKLKVETETIAAEGWRWIEVAPDFAYGHSFGLRRLRGETVALTAEEEATRDAFQAEYDQLADQPGLSSLRFHPRCYYRPDMNAPTQTWPALIAAVTDLDGRITGLQRTWLARDGSGKAPVDTPRRAMGDLLGHAVRFGVAADVFAAGEGIETVLSARSVLPHMPMLAAGSAAHLAAILFPQGLRRLYILRDRDPAGSAACDRLSERATSAGIETVVVSPRQRDFNEDLLHPGPAALQALLRCQLAPDDVSRFLTPTG